jgi:hypothetical protein
MENAINIGTFVQYLTYYIKMGIYINKGTENDKCLERCIKTYNKYKLIEASKEISEEDEIFVRKCLKRMNLILKIDDDNKPVDIRKKENQLKMIFLKGHPSLETDDLDAMIEYASAHEITIMTDIPLTFMLKKCDHQLLVWEYTRLLFYISQLLVSKVSPGADPTNPTIAAKKEVFDSASIQLETILEKISDLEQNMQINKMMVLDQFLNSKLVKTGITDKNVDEARNEVKEIFNKKGLGDNNSMTKMIDLISDQLVNVDLSKGNIIESMFGIAKSVAEEMRGDLQNDPEKFQKTVGTIVEVFQEATNNPNNQGAPIPAELKNVFDGLLSNIPQANGQSEMNVEPSAEEINDALEHIVQTNNLDRNEFFGAITDSNGEVDMNLLEKYLAGVGNEMSNTQ